MLTTHRMFSLADYDGGSVVTLCPLIAGSFFTCRWPLQNNTVCLIVVLPVSVLIQQLAK